ncbi:cation transporter [Mesorhizobium quangtriensis]|uniref:cation transporter n=1 Tax=Mesorhizobium quangtriensis TaxID=3157709 RepID=UPI003CCD81EB
MDTAFQKTRFRIEGMDCAACAAKIDKVARGAPGVREVSVSATAGTMLLEHDDRVDLESIAAGLVAMRDEPRADAREGICAQADRIAVEQFEGCVERSESSNALRASLTASLRVVMAIRSRIVTSFRRWPITIFVKASTDGLTSAEDVRELRSP